MRCRMDLLVVLMSDDLRDGWDGCWVKTARQQDEEPTNESLKAQAKETANRQINHTIV